MHVLAALAAPCALSLLLPCPPTVAQPHLLYCCHLLQRHCIPPADATCRRVTVSSLLLLPSCSFTNFSTAPFCLPSQRSHCCSLQLPPQMQPFPPCCTTATPLAARCCSTCSSSLPHLQLVAAPPATHCCSPRSVLCCCCHCHTQRTKPNPLKIVAAAHLQLHMHDPLKICCRCPPVACIESLAVSTRSCHHCSLRSVMHCCCHCHTRLHQTESAENRRCCPPATPPHTL